MRELLIPALGYLLSILLPIVGSYLTMLARRYVHNDAALKAIQAIGHIARIAVTNAAQRTVQDLKDPANPIGTWDKVAAAAVKKSVSEDVKAMSGQWLATLSSHGFSDAQTEMLVDQTIEAAVHTLAKTSPTSATSADPWILQ